MDNENYQGDSSPELQDEMPAEQSVIEPVNENSSRVSDTSVHNSTIQNNDVEKQNKVVTFSDCKLESEPGDSTIETIVPSLGSTEKVKDEEYHTVPLNGLCKEETDGKTEDSSSKEDGGPLVDIALIPSKLSYFFMECFGGSFVPFIVVFLHSTGLTLTEAGFITGIRLLSSSIAAPLWGYLADHTGHRKIIFAVLCIGMASTIFPMPWIGNACSASGHFGRSPNKSAIVNLTLNLEGILSLTEITEKFPQNFLKVRYGLQEKDEQKYSLMGFETYEKDTTLVSEPYKPFSSTLFYVMLSLVFVSNIFSNPINGIVDSFVMNVVKSHHRKSDYGKQRMFGAIGFGVSNFLAGMAADYYHEEGMSKYTAIFYVFLPSVVLLLPCGLVLGSQTTVEEPEDDRPQSHSKVKLLKQTFRNPDNLMFLLSTFVIGIINAVVIGYMFKLMEDQMHATKTAMGLANLVASLAEIIVFPFSGRILNLCGGGIGGIMLAFFSYFLRLIMVAYMKNQWLVLPTMILNCLSFALFWTSAMEYTQKIAPKEIYITMFSILNSVYFNVAGLLGYLGGGLFYDVYGGQVLFLTCGILSGVWVGVMVMYYHVYKRLRRRRLEINPNAEVPSTYSSDNAVV